MLSTFPMSCLCHSVGNEACLRSFYSDCHIRAASSIIFVFVSVSAWNIRVD